MASSTECRVSKAFLLYPDFNLTLLIRLAVCALRVVIIVGLSSTPSSVLDLYPDMNDFCVKAHVCGMSTALALNLVASTDGGLTAVRK